MTDIRFRSVVVALSVVLATVLRPDAGNAFEDDTLVYRKCVSCHAERDGKLSRVEDIRTTPEEWTVIVDRMHRLHGMSLEAGDMDRLLKELTATQSLTPAEADGVAYINLFNNPQRMEAPHGPDEEQVHAACVRCHSAAKIYSYRMTAPEWMKLRDFHIYIDPAIMLQMREMHWRSEADRALRYLARTLPYERAWTAPDQNPAGDWLILGTEPGRANFRGRATVTAQGDDDYAITGDLRFADGMRESFSGHATLYGGYALRMRTRHNGSAVMGAFTLIDGVIRGQHHHPAPDFRTASSTWFPAQGPSRALRLTPGFLLHGEETRLVVEGRGLPEVEAGEVVPSSEHVEVLEATTISPESIELLVVYQGARHGRTRLNIKGLATPELLLAPDIDYLTITPAIGRARVHGGLHYPAEGVQFEALAHSRGPDPNDAGDDYLLGPVAARFSLAEEITRPNDDDLVHLRPIEADGTYLPSTDYAPLPARQYGTEGIGLVKVIAVYERDDTALTAEARLVVTVPDYIQRIR